MDKRLQAILQRIYEADVPQVRDLESVLKVQDAYGLRQIYDFADRVRQEWMGDGIALRGIVEFSNYCRNKCFYCGLNSDNRQLVRYHLSKEQVLASVAQIEALGVKTVVLQSGETEGCRAEWLGGIIRDIKARFDMAVTLSAGECSADDYRQWYYAGADRYLLKVETSEKRLYEQLHPGSSYENRIGCLRTLKELGYQSGSGIIVGLRGQTISSLARDIVFFKQEGFDMLGIGPFIPHPQTQLAAEQPACADMVLKVLALTRIVTKCAHMPATTALGSLGGKDLRIEGLKAGANVVMLNFTPQEYKKYYEIYPGKRCLSESPSSYRDYVHGLVRQTGRRIDYSRADALNMCRV